MAKKQEPDYLILKDGSKFYLHELQNRDLGTERLKPVLSTVVLVVAIVQSIVLKNLKVFTVIKNLKKFVGGFVTVFRHGKELLAEIKDLTDEEIEEMKNFVIEESDGDIVWVTLIEFLEVIIKLKNLFS